MASGKEYRDIDGLYEAARYGRLEDVKQCLQYGVDVNGKDWYGDTPLNVALRNRHSQIVQILVSKGARYDIDGLVKAASDGRLEDVKQHLHNKVDVNGKNRSGDIPLNAALRNRHSQIVQFLVSKGARYNIDGLVSAARDVRLEDVKQHLQNGVDVNGRNKNGRTPLYWATLFGYSEVIEILISKGAKRHTYNIDELVDAARHGRLEDVKQHLQNEVDVNGKDVLGKTPLNVALMGGHSQIVQLLVSKGARYDINGLVDVARGGRLEDVKIHLQNGVDVNGKNRYGDTPLNAALRNRHSQIVQFLVSKGARYDINGLVEAVTVGRLEDVKQHLHNEVDINGKNRDDDTPLNVALRKGHSQVVQLLVSKGARYDINGLIEAVNDGRLEGVKQHLHNEVDVNGKNYDDDTPLNVALRKGHSQVVQLLVSKGARYDINGLIEAVNDGRLEGVKQHLHNEVDVNGKNYYGDTPLNVALMKGRSLVVQLLVSKGARGDHATEIVKNFKENKRNTITILQRCITKAKKQKGKVKVTFIKLLFTGSGKAGKTSFSNLLMKNKFVNFHHSTNIVKATHAVSVKTAFIAKSHQSDDQNVVWLEINEDSQISHLRQILISLDVSSLQKNKEVKSSSSSLPQPRNTTSESPKPIQSDNVIKASAKKDYVTKQTSVAQRLSGFFQGSVKSEKLASFDTLVENSIESNIFKRDIDYQEQMLSIITLLDTGGQPEYIHLLPTVNIHPMVNFVIHDLSKSLEDQVLVEFSENGELVFEPYHLTYSNLDMIKFLMSSINDSLERISQIPQLVTIPGKNSNSYLCCIGTHVDKVDKDAIHNIDSQLTVMVKNLHCKTAVWQNKDGGVLFPVDNTTAGDVTKEDPIANCVRNKVDKLSRDKDLYELPITWMLFELEIRQVCAKASKAYISLEECYFIAQRTNLIPNKEEARSALIYHHLLGVLLYYPDVPGLCDHVIIDHQWFFDTISSLVCLTFKQSSNLHAIDSLKYNGILTKELIQELNWKIELKRDHFIALLVKMKIIAPVQREDSIGEDFFIPYILPTYSIRLSSNNILSQYGCLQGEPFLIQFVSNLLPRGFFCSLAVQILQQLPKNKNYLYTSTKDVRHTYSNLITFRLQNAYSLSLIDNLSYLEVQIRHQESYYYHQFPIHIDVQHILSTALVIVCEQLAYNHGRIQYGFTCQCGEYDNHIALLTRLTPPFDYALCRYGSVVSTKLKDEHKVWLQKDFQNNYVPVQTSITAKNVPIQQPSTSCFVHSGQPSMQYKLFTDYYNKLVITLPANDLSHYFVSDKIISIRDHERIIRSTVPQDAAELLLNRLSLQLQNGNDILLNKMLLIMDYHGTDAAKAISLQIRSKLSLLECKDSTVSSSGQDLHSAEYEVYICYYSQIVNSLSVETLSPHFVSHNIISPSEQLKILSVPSPIEAAGLLLSKISCALDAEITESFYKFLDIIDQYGSTDSKTVNTAMRKRLLEMKSTKNKGTEDDVSKDDDLPDPAVGEGPKTIA